MWRAPIDNDAGTHGPEQLAAAWRAAGLDRMTERVLGVELDGRRLVVRVRVAAAGTRPRARRHLSVDRRRRRARVRASPSSRDGEWPFPLPRLGTRMALPAALGRLEWFGLGPGEAYADSRAGGPRRPLRDGPSTSSRRRT